MRYQTILFDVDGTMVDSERPVMESFADTLKALNLPAPDDALLEIAMRDTCINAMTAAGAPDVPFAHKLWIEYMGRAMENIRPCPAIPEVVRALKAMGCKLGIVTSRSRPEVAVDPSLRELVPLFETVICVEDVERTKPDPQPMLVAMEHLGSDPATTLYIGDSPTDAMSAHAAGIDFALAVWGYRPGEPIRAEHYLTKPEDLIEIQRSENRKWLDWAKELQFIAQAGLEYSRDPFDIERFRRVREIAVEIMHEGTDMEIDKIRDLFCNESGYQTPKLDTRAAVFDGDKILLVRERNGLWALPGGWADFNLSISENAVKEIFEEAGLKAELVKLVALQDHIRHNRHTTPYGIITSLVICKSLGGEFAPNTETTEIGWFPLNGLPPLDVNKTSLDQIRLCFAARRDGWQTIVD